MKKKMALFLAIAMFISLIPMHPRDVSGFSPPSNRASYVRSTGSSGWRHHNNAVYWSGWQQRWVNDWKIAVNLSDYRTAITDISGGRQQLVLRVTLSNGEFADVTNKSNLRWQSWSTSADSTARNRASYTDVAGDILRWDGTISSGSAIRYDLSVLSSTTADLTIRSIEGNKLWDDAGWNTATKEQQLFASLPNTIAFSTINNSVRPSIRISNTSNSISNTITTSWSNPSNPNDPYYYDPYYNYYNDPWYWNNRVSGGGGGGGSSFPTSSASSTSSQVSPVVQAPPDWAPSNPQSWDPNEFKMPARLTQRMELVIGSTSYMHNGVYKQLNAAPEIVNDSAMVPLRFVAEAFGANVEWVAATDTANIYLGGNMLSVTVGVMADGMHTPAINRNGSVLVPIRFVGSAFGAQFEFNEATRTVYITR